MEFKKIAALCCAAVALMLCVPQRCAAEEAVAASAEISEENAGISIIPHENAAINAKKKISEKHTKQTVALENLEALIINPP